MSNKTIIILGTLLIIALGTFIVRAAGNEVVLGGTPPATANIISTTTAEWYSFTPLTTSTDFSTSTIVFDYTTTTISADKRSLYHPTSTDDLRIAQWDSATGTDGSGTPPKILRNAKGSRRYAQICWQEGGSLELFLTDVTTTDIKIGRGIPIQKNLGDCYTINSLNLWQGAVYALASSSTSTVSVTEAK